MAGRFKIFLLKFGVKQYELAEACGWAESKVSLFANGRRVPAPDEVLKMAQALGITEEKLRKGGGWPSG